MSNPDLVNTIKAQLKQDSIQFKVLNLLSELVFGMKEAKNGLLYISGVLKLRKAARDVAGIILKHGAMLSIKN